MSSKTLIKCSICDSIKFEPTTIGWICATEGKFNINAYACQNCGHIELFAPNLDFYAKHLREKREAQQKKKELEQKKLDEARQLQIKKLTDIINNEDSTVRQVNEAKKELERFLNPQLFNSKDDWN